MVVLSTPMSRQAPNTCKTPHSQERHQSSRLTAVSQFEIEKRAPTWISVAGAARMRFTKHLLRFRRFHWEPLWSERTTT